QCQKEGMRVPSRSAFGFFSQARIQSGRSLDLASRKLGAAEAGSWLGASFPITWQEVHFNSAISAVASFEICGLISCETGVRYGQLFCDAAAKKWTSSVASWSAKWKVGIRIESQGLSGIGPRRNPNSHSGCTRQPSPVRM